MGQQLVAYLTDDPGMPDFSRAPILHRADVLATKFGVDAEELIAGQCGPVFSTFHGESPSFG